VRPARRHGKHADAIAGTPQNVHRVDDRSIASAERARQHVFQIEQLIFGVDPSGRSRLGVVKAPQPRRSVADHLDARGPGLRRQEQIAVNRRPVDPLRQIARLVPQQQIGNGYAKPAFVPHCAVDLLQGLELAARTRFVRAPRIPVPAQLEGRRRR